MFARSLAYSCLKSTRCGFEWKGTTTNLRPTEEHGHISNIDIVAFSSFPSNSICVWSAPLQQNGNEDA